MCFMVLSAMSCLHQLSCVDSIVTGYSSSQGATHLPISSFGFRKCWTVCRLKCVVFVATMKQWSPGVQEGPRPLKCDLGGLDVVCIICCTEISVATFCLGEWLQCLLWCQSSVQQKVASVYQLILDDKEKVEGGTKYSSVPKTPPSSVNCLRGPCAGTQA